VTQIEEEYTPDAVHHDLGTSPGHGRAEFRKMLKATINYEASDLHIKAGTKPRIRVRGLLRNLDTDVVSEPLCYQIAKDILDSTQYKYFHKHGQIDLAYDFDDDHRFRVNVFMARSKPSLACRLITANIMTFEDLHLPDILAEVSMRASGLVLFAGITGSGKSTSIAAMLNYINKRKRCHIVTIEDPIEYIFNDDKASINQREVGIDCLNFNEALRALVREDPDIVFIGEMRDYETFEAAIRAAETGHLVFGTIHASSAWQTFGRIYDLFPPSERPLIRKLLAYNLQAIVYQKLLPTLREDTPRIPALEILLSSPVVTKYILDGKEGELLEVIQKGHEEGMIDFNSALLRLVEQEWISMKIAMEATPKPEELKMKLKGIA